jgi:hypothetical protein
MSPTPCPIDPPDVWTFGPVLPVDAIAALMDGTAVRCLACNKATLRVYLCCGICPGCIAVTRMINRERNRLGQEEA